MCKSKTLEANYPETCSSLKTWAMWQSGQLVSGFPKMSIEQAAIEGGGIDTRGSGLHIVSNPEAERIEKVLLELKQIELKQFLAIKFYFSDETMTFRRLGKVLGFQKSNTHEILKRAVAWVDEKLNIVQK